MGKKIICNVIFVILQVVEERVTLCALNVVDEVILDPDDLPLSSEDFVVAWFAQTFAC